MQNFGNKNRQLILFKRQGSPASVVPKWGNVHDSYLAFIEI